MSTAAMSTRSCCSGALLHDHGIEPVVPERTSRCAAPSAPPNAPGPPNSMTSGQPPGRRHHRAHHTRHHRRTRRRTDYYIQNGALVDIAGNRIWDLSARLIDDTLARYDRRASPADWAAISPRKPKPFGAAGSRCCAAVASSPHAHGALRRKSKCRPAQTLAVLRAINASLHDCGRRTNDMTSFRSMTSPSPAHLRRSPSQQRSRDRVERILDAAAAIVDEEGLDALKVVDIAKAGPPSPWHAVPVLRPQGRHRLRPGRTVRQRFADVLEASLAGLDADCEWHELLDLLLDAYTAYYRSEPALRELWVGARLDPEFIRPTTSTTTPDSRTPSPMRWPTRRRSPWTSCRR